MKINPRHKAFCDEYLKNGMNATQAYMSVYKSVTKELTARTNGSKLLTNTNIKEYIAKRQEKVSLKSQMTMEYVLDKLKFVVDNSIEEGTPTKEGKITDRQSIVAALKEVNKMLGYNAAEKHDVEIKEVKFAFDTLTPRK